MAAKFCQLPGHFHALLCTSGDGCQGRRTERPSNFENVCPPQARFVFPSSRRDLLSAASEDEQPLLQMAPRQPQTRSGSPPAATLLVHLQLVWDSLLTLSRTSMAFGSFEGVVISPPSPVISSACVRLLANVPTDTAASLKVANAGRAFHSSNVEEVHLLTSSIGSSWTAAPDDIELDADFYSVRRQHSSWRPNGRAPAACLEHHLDPQFIRLFHNRKHHTPSKGQPVGRVIPPLVVVHENKLEKKV
ncbi:hypothetical protein BU16DRAFT_544964 [Lophium mytilinum]|uniref:Uncharacterized protein n=1 Tax=Lophium mytilinum TaxID=390894 RepID=A0A6A6QBG3_9PEZI|nr:hypothetical protein BU16DRAFT_544964 [Lophium mytilinum]